ncbi:MAG: LamG-like jellyroll fold domain-containing protein [Spirochaetota bacterium]
MKNLLYVVLCTAVLPLMINCGGSSKSSQSPRFNGSNNEIIAYTFTSDKNKSYGIKTDVTGQIKDNTISLEVPYAASVDALIADFVTNSSNIEVNGVIQESGVTTNDFTGSVTYTVFADDNTKRDYTIIVTKAKNTEKKITAYSINGTAGTIDEDKSTIVLSLPPHTDATSLKATFSFIGKSIIANNSAQTSGVTQNDFTNPVIYTVNADDGSSRTYTVTVSVEKDTRNDITYFAFIKDYNPSLVSDVTGIISGTDIQCVLPFGSGKADLVADFTSLGESVTVDSGLQETGVTHNDFTSSKIYRVTAENGSAKDYTVTVTVAKSDAKALTLFTLDGETGIIDENSNIITVKFASTKNLTNLIAVFAATGVSVKVNGTEQTSGVTQNDFTNDVIYRVTADNESIRDYTVKAEKASDITGIWNFEYTSDGSYTVQGTTQVPGVTGTALQFNGLTDYIYQPDSDALTLASGGSIEVVLKAVTHRPYAGIVHKGVLNDFSDETYSFQFWGLNGTDGTLRFLVHNTEQDADHYTYIDSITKLNTNTWYHLLAVWDTTHLAIYINGVKDVSLETAVGEVKNSEGGLVIGAQLNHAFSYSPWGDLGFNGIIDRVEILNRPLNDTEAQTRYQDFLNLAGPGFTAYLLYAAKHNIPYIVLIFTVILAALAGLYAYNRKRAQAVK